MSTPHRYVSGAIDLAEVKARAEAREQAATAPAGQGSQGIATFVNVTAENFEADIVQRSLQIPVAVLVGTPRSPISEQLKVDLHSLAAAGNHAFIVGYVDADTSPDVAQAFGVEGLPTVIALAGGRPVTQFEGEQPREAIKNWLDSIVEQVGSQLQGLPVAPEEAEAEPEDPRMEAASVAVDSGDFDGALAIYEEILAAEPTNTEVKQARDTTVLLKRLDPAGRTEDPVAAAEADPSDIDKQFDAADAEVIIGTPQQAFARLTAVLATQVGDDKTRVRDRLVELFALFDASDPRVVEARRNMASALF